MTSEHPATRTTLRIIAATGAILSIPLIAMQFSDEVVWTASDFAVAGALLLGTGLGYQASTRRGGGTAYRIGVGLLLGSTLFLVWANLAVGLIGSEDDPANLMYFAVVAIAILGTALARFRAGAMARVAFTMAATQAVIGAIALIGRMGGSESGAMEIIGVNAMYIALFSFAGVILSNAEGGGADHA